MKTDARFVMVALLALASCGRRSTLEGTYVGSGSGQARVASGETTPFTLPDDTLVVEVLTQSYQYYAYRLTLRGCKVRAEGDADHADVGGGETCTFDVPSVGPVTVNVSGGISREPGGVHVSIFGTGKEGTSAGYSLHGKPRNPR